MRWAVAHDVKGTALVNPIAHRRRFAHIQSGIAIAAQKPVDRGIVRGLEAPERPREACDGFARATTWAPSLSKTPTTGGGTVESI